MVIPNVLTNIHQLYLYRKSILPMFYTISFALGGGIGAFLGTVFLVNLPLDFLSICVGIIVTIYIGFKIKGPIISV